MSDKRTRLLSTAECASLVRLSYSTLTKWRVSPPASGPIPYIKCGRAVRYEEDAVLTWLKDRQRTSTANEETDTAWERQY